MAPCLCHQRFCRSCGDAIRILHLETECHACHDVAYVDLNKMQWLIRRPHKGVEPKVLLSRCNRNRITSTVLVPEQTPLLHTHHFSPVFWASSLAPDLLRPPHTTQHHVRLVCAQGGRHRHCSRPQNRHCTLRWHAVGTWALQHCAVTPHSPPADRATICAFTGFPRFSGRVRGRGGC